MSLAQHDRARQGRLCGRKAYTMPANASRIGDVLPDYFKRIAEILDYADAEL